MLQLPEASADMYVVDDACLVIYDHNKPVNVYSYDQKDSHGGAKTVNAAGGYDNPHSAQICILIINQATHINGLENFTMTPVVLSEW